MRNFAYDPTEMSPPEDDFGKIVLAPLWRVLPIRDSAATVSRLFNSRHVKDLRFIVALGLIGLIVVFVLGLFFSFEAERVKQWKEIHAALLRHHSRWIYVQVGIAAVGRFLAFFLPVLGAFSAVTAWCYQAGSARLGVVDLFACEISTLCQVTTIVDAAQRYIHRYDEGPPPPSPAPAHPPAPQFASQEDYFPIFESNSRDLQSLEARVVINITAFYTFMKAMRDSLRALGSVPAQPSDFEAGAKGRPPIGSWREAAIFVVYMLFLALESARKAVADLVEFEPEVAERIITVLVSELEAYGFLLRHFTDAEDMRHQRIILRRRAYEILTPELISLVETASAAGDPQREAMWAPAKALLPELRQRYRAAIGERRETPAGQGSDASSA